MIYQGMSCPHPNAEKRRKTALEKDNLQPSIGGQRRETRGLQFSDPQSGRRPQAPASAGGGALVSG